MQEKQKIKVRQSVHIYEASKMHGLNLARVYPSSCSMKWLGIFLLPPGWDISSSQGSLWHLICWYPFIHLGGAKDCMRKVSCPKITQFPQPAKLRPLDPELSANHVPPISLKVTVDLQGCLPKNHSYAHCLYYNHRKVYIIVKLIKCRINFFKFWFNGKRAQAFKCKTDTIC